MDTRNVRAPLGCLRCQRPNNCKLQKEQNKNKDISLIHKKKISQVSHKRAKPPFLWSPSMTEYVLLLQIRHFEMQIWTWKRTEKAALNKSGFGLKGFTLCHGTTFQDGFSQRPELPCCTFQVNVLQRAATGLIAPTRDSSLKCSRVSASRRNMQREEFLIKKSKHFKIPKEKTPAVACPAVEDLRCAERLRGGSVWNWMRASPSSACE